MDTIYNLLKRAKELKEKSQVDSITPEEVGKLHEDTLAYISSLEQSTDGLGIKKVYQSKSAMEADTDPVGTNGKALRYGQLVSIYDDAHVDSSENGNIYAYQKPGWLLMGKVSGGAGLSIAQELGDSATKVMSQAAVKKALENIPKSDIDVDSTLSEEGKPADAKVVGLKLNEVDSRVTSIAYEIDDSKVTEYKSFGNMWRINIGKKLLVIGKTYEAAKLLTTVLTADNYSGDAKIVIARPKQNDALFPCVITKAYDVNLAGTETSVRSKNIILPKGCMIGIYRDGQKMDASGNVYYAEGASYDKNVEVNDSGRGGNHNINTGFSFVDVVDKLGAIDDLSSRLDEVEKETVRSLSSTDENKPGFQTHSYEVKPDTVYHVEADGKVASQPLVKLYNGSSTKAVVTESSFNGDIRTMGDTTHIVVSNSRGVSKISTVSDAKSVKNELEALNKNIVPSEVLNGKVVYTGDKLQDSPNTTTTAYKLSKGIYYLRAYLSIDAYSKKISVKHPNGTFSVLKNNKYTEGFFEGYIEIEEDNSYLYICQFSNVYAQPVLKSVVSNVLKATTTQMQSEVITLAREMHDTYAHSYLDSIQVVRNRWDFGGFYLISDFVKPSVIGGSVEITINNASNFSVKEYIAVGNLTSYDVYEVTAKNGNTLTCTLYADCNQHYALGATVKKELSLTVTGKTDYSEKINVYHFSDITRMEAGRMPLTALVDGAIHPTNDVYSLIGRFAAQRMRGLMRDEQRVVFYSDSWENVLVGIKDNLFGTHTFEKRSVGGDTTMHIRERFLADIAAGIVSNNDFFVFMMGTNNLLRYNGATAPWIGDIKQLMHDYKYHYLNDVRLITEKLNGNYLIISGQYADYTWG